MLYVVGIDPGFANVGYAVLGLPDGFSAQDGHKPSMVSCGTLRTQNTGKKRNVRAADDKTERLEQIRVAVRDLVVMFNPIVVGVEELTCVRQAAVSQKLALVWGSIYTIVKERDIPLVYFTPSDVKRGIGLPGTAEKDAMIAEINKRFRGAVDQVMPAGVRQHAADAAAIAICALADERVKLAMRMRRS